MTKGERNAVCSLKNDNSIIVKEADKGSAVVAWDREARNLEEGKRQKEAKNQLNDKNVYKEFTGDVEGPLEKIIKTVIQKVRDSIDISDNTLDYLLVNNPRNPRKVLHATENL